MRYYWLPIVLVFATPSLRSNTINVTGDTFALLQTGDELLVQFNIQNYEVNARRYGAPALPQSIDLLFVTDPSNFDGQFEASLVSRNGSTVLPFPDLLSFTPGYFQGPRYAGPISTLTASIDLSSQAANALFPRANATLDLRNLGGDVELGLPPYTLGQDFNIGLDGGPISVGARITSVKLEHNSSSPVPEPNSGLLMVGGGAILCLLARLMGRSDKDSSIPR
jgi:hypothetical protein